MRMSSIDTLQPFSPHKKCSITESSNNINPIDSSNRVNEAGSRSGASFSQVSPSFRLRTLDLPQPEERESTPSSISFCGGVPVQHDRANPLLKRLGDSLSLTSDGHSLHGGRENKSSTNSLSFDKLKHCHGSQSDELWNSFSSHSQVQYRHNVQPKIRAVTGHQILRAHGVKKKLTGKKAESQKKKRGAQNQKQLLPSSTRNALFVSGNKPSSFKTDNLTLPLLSRNPVKISQLSGPSFLSSELSAASCPNKGLTGSQFDFSPFSTSLSPHSAPFGRSSNAQGIQWVSSTNPDLQYKTKTPLSATSPLSRRNNQTPPTSETLNELLFPGKFCKLRIRV